MKTSSSVLLGIRPHQGSSTSGSERLRLDDQAAKTSGTKRQIKPIDLAHCEIIALKRFKKLMKENARKFTFAGYS